MSNRVWSWTAPDRSWIPVKLIKVTVGDKKIAVVENEESIQERTVEHFIVEAQTVNDKLLRPPTDVIHVPCAPVRVASSNPNRRPKLGLINEGGDHLYRACGYLDEMNRTDPHEAARRMRDHVVLAQVRHFKVEKDGDVTHHYNLNPSNFHPYVGE